MLTCWELHVGPGSSPGSAAALPIGSCLPPWKDGPRGAETRAASPAETPAFASLQAWELPFGVPFACLPRASLPSTQCRQPAGAGGPAAGGIGVTARRIQARLR